MKPRSSRPAQPTTTLRPIARSTYTPISLMSTFCQNSVIVGGRKSARITPTSNRFLDAPEADRSEKPAGDSDSPARCAAWAASCEIGAAPDRAATKAPAAINDRPMQASQPPEPRFCQGPVAASTSFAAPILLMSYSVMTVSSTPINPTPVATHAIARCRRYVAANAVAAATANNTQPSQATYCALTGLRPYPLKASWVRDRVRLR